MVRIMTAIDKRYYDCAEFAAMFGVPVEAIRRRVYKREIPHLRIGHRWIRFTDAHISEIERIFTVKARPAPVLLTGSGRPDLLSGPISPPCQPRVGCNFRDAAVIRQDAGLAG
jgi:hypothetical protein